MTLKKVHINDIKLNTRVRMWGKVYFVKNDNEAENEENYHILRGDWVTYRGTYLSGYFGKSYYFCSADGKHSFISPTTLISVLTIKAEEKFIVHSKALILFPEESLEKVKEVFKDLRQHDIKGKDYAGPFVCPNYRSDCNFRITKPTNLTQIAIIYSDGKAVYPQNRYCHAGLNVRGYSPDYINIPYVVSYIVNRGDKMSYEDVRYYEWLFNRSPWKACFITKTFNEAFESGIVMNPNSPNNLFGGAAIATRLPTEWNRGKSFCFFLDKGFNENISYILSHFYQSTVLGEVILRATSSHVAICLNMKKKGIINFITSSPTFLNENYSTSKEYRNINETWNGRGMSYESYENSLKKVLDKIPTSEELNIYIEKVRQAILEYLA